MILPPVLPTSSLLTPLQPGDRIGLVAPSSPFAPEKWMKTCKVLEDAGYCPVPGKHVLESGKYLTGTEAQRAQDLIHSIADPSLKAVFCIRGGYGSSRLLPWLPFSKLRKTPKIFLGYSDITFLHLAFQNRMQWITFHGPNAIELGDSTDKLQETLDPLQGKTVFSWDLQDAHVIRPGAASGVLLGGNLTCLVHLLGTPFLPDLEGALLLVEDCSEALYRLDRLFTHLRLAGLLKRIRGLILGQFENCGESQEIWEMVREQVKLFDFPVVANLPFGHGNQNQVIPLGLPFLLNTYDGIFKALQHPFRK